MKKFVISFLFVVNFAFAQQHYNGVPPFLWYRIMEYKPLTPNSLYSSNFFESLSVQESDCNGLWEYYQRISCYPSDRLGEDSLMYSSLFFSENKAWGPSLVKMIANTITDSLYVNEYRQGEIRFESCFPKIHNLIKNEYQKSLRLHSFIPENDKLYGLLSEPIDILHGARLELIYNIINRENGQIFIDDEQPLIYEIQSAEDSVTHIFSFKLKDEQFNNIKFALMEINIIPPVQYDYVQITKDSVGKTCLWGDIPIWISAFENGMLHFIFDGRNIFEVKQAFAGNNGKFAALKPDIATLSYVTYDYCRKNPGLTHDELCELFADPQNMRRILVDHKMGNAVDYGAFIACLGVDVNEIHLSKEHVITYDEILGSRVIMLNLDSLDNSYHYSLLKKGEDGVLRMLHEDTTRTSPVYEGLDEEISENLEYPKAALDSGSEAIVLIAFMVNIDGTMSDIRLFSDPWDHLLDEEALRVVKLLKNKWIPATLHGEPVEMQVIIPIDFSTK